MNSSAFKYLCECHLRSLTFVCPNSSSFLFIYICSEISKYLPGFLVVFCTTYFSVKFYQNELTLNEDTFFFLYKSFFKGSNPIIVLCVSALRDTLLTADLSGNLPIGISLPGQVICHLCELIIISGFSLLLQRHPDQLPHQHISAVT